MGFISWLMRGLKLVLLAILCGIFLFEGAILGFSGLAVNNSAMALIGLVFLIIGAIIGLYIIYKYNLISEWTKPRPYREPRRERVVVVKQKEPGPYYIGPGLGIETGQKAIPKGKKRK